MKFILSSMLSVIFLFSALVSIRASDLETRAKLDVYVPPILYPRNGTIWYVGQRHNVTWDNSNPPVNITNRFGQIRLRKSELTFPLILANNFDIRRGRIEITVPFVSEGEYSLVLFGDSGNFSPLFTIHSPVKF